MRLFTYSFEGRRGFTLPYHEILAFETSVESHRIKVYYANHSIKTIYGSLKDIAAKLKKITLSMPIAIHWLVYRPLKR